MKTGTTTTEQAEGSPLVIRERSKVDELLGQCVVWLAFVAHTATERSNQVNAAELLNEIEMFRDDYRADGDAMRNALATIANSEPNNFDANMLRAIARAAIKEAIR